MNCSLDKSRGFDSNLSLEIASSLEGEHSGVNEDFDDHEFLHDPTYGAGVQSQESNIFIAHEDVKKSSKSASCGELSETSDEEISDEVKPDHLAEERIEKENEGDNLKANEVESEDSEDDIEDEIIEENLISEKSDSSKEKRYKERRENLVVHQKTNELKNTNRRISKASVDSASTEMDLNRISFVEDHVPKLYSEITESSDCFGESNVTPRDLGELQLTVYLALIPEENDEEPVQVKRKKSKKFRSIRKFFGFLFSCTKA